MEFTPAQGIICEDRHRFRVVNCGRRFGKTTLAVVEMVAKAVSQKNMLVSYVAPTYQQARDICWAMLVKLSRPVIKVKNETRLELVLRVKGGGTSTITLRGWENIETMRGLKNDFLVLDEVASYRNFTNNWQQVLRPTLTDTKGHGLFISTPKGFNHFYDLYNEEHKDADYKSFHYTSYDNPLLAKEELEKVKLELPEDSFSQEYLADFRKVEGLVYKEFDRQRHVYTTLPEVRINETIAGIDPGFTNPCAVLTIKVDADSNYWIDDEYYKKGQTDAYNAEFVATQGFNVVYPDPENAGFIKELTQRGVNVREVTKGAGSVISGINKVRELFKANRIKINANNCPNLIYELETYSYPQRKGMQNENENPIKTGDHTCFTKDALIDLPIGEILLQQKTGMKDVYEFMGSKVTADHPYLTPRGFVRLDALRYDDYICKWKNWLLMELSLDDTQTQRGVKLGTILYLLQRNVLAIKQNVFIGIYGKRNLVKFPRAFISIIKTGIQLTTIYLISNLFHLRNITQNTIKKIYRNGLKILRLLERMPVNGMEAQQGFLSIKGLGHSLGKTIKSIKRIAFSAERNTQPLFQPTASSVMLIARLKHLGKEDVYSTLTTNGFFAVNGIVVSNCDALRYSLMTHTLGSGFSNAEEQADRLLARLRNLPMETR